MDATKGLYGNYWLNFFSLSIQKAHNLSHCPIVGLAFTLFCMLPESNTTVKYTYSVNRMHHFMFAIILAIANSIAQFGIYGKIINVKILRFKLKYTSYKSMNPMRKNQKLQFHGTLQWK